MSDVSSSVTWRYLPWAAAAAVGVGSVVFRSLTLDGYSSVPAGFDGPMAFRQNYLLTHGHFLLAPVETASYWSGAVNTQLGTYLMEAVNAGVLALAGPIALKTELLHQIILTSALIMLSMVALYQCNRVPKVGDAVLIAALVTLGSPVAINFMTGWNVAYAWVWLLAFSVVFTGDAKRVWTLAALVALVLLAAPLYHTFGLLMALYAVFLWVVCKITGIRRQLVSPIFVIVAFLAYQVYVSVQFFGELVGGLRDVLTLDILARDPSQPVAPTPVMLGPINLQYVHLTVYVLLAAPIALIAVRLAREFFHDGRHNSSPSDSAVPRYSAAIVSLSAAVAFLAFAFGLRFSGEFFLNRGAEYLTVPAVLAVVAQLPKRRLAMYAIGACVVSLSALSFWVHSSGIYSSTRITHSEAAGYSWVAPRLASDSVVLTDFRLSGPFIANGHFAVVGVTGQGSERTDELLDAIYYESTPGTVTESINRLTTYRNDRPADYLFLSTLMMREYPSINGYGTRFPPVPARFFDSLEESGEWRLVFENDHARIYERERQLSRGLSRSLAQRVMQDILRPTSSEWSRLRQSDAD